MATIDLSDAELELLIEALGAKLEDKRAAFELAQRHPATSTFTERDFGIPQINALLLRIEAKYNEE